MSIFLVAQQRFNGASPNHAPGVAGDQTFATIRHRTKRSVMFKLSQCAEKKWRRLRGFDYLAKVITGVKFKDGIEVKEIDQVAA